LDSSWEIRPATRDLFIFPDLLDWISRCTASKAAKIRESDDLLEEDSRELPAIMVVISNTVYQPREPSQKLCSLESIDVAT
jgi:hypothetical protein